MQFFVCSALPHWFLLSDTGRASISIHRRSRDYVWECTFSCQKSWRPFFSRRPQKPSKYTSKYNMHSKKTVVKLTLALAGGCTSCPGGALTHFSCRIRLNNFFSPPWGVQVHPLHPLATPMLAHSLVLNAGTSLTRCIDNAILQDVAVSVETETATDFWYAEFTTCARVRGTIFAASPPSR